MKINEVEALVGITKKNIRFYEEKGLINPARSEENKYRDYSEEDDLHIIDNGIKKFTYTNVRDGLKGEYEALVEAMYLTKYLADTSNKDLVKVDYNPIVKKLYKYRGQL